METSTQPTTEKNMINWVSQLFPMRALAEYDKKYGFYVAYCLETGSVTTADDMNTVLDMMKELLEDEVNRVLKSKNLSNLFSNPAPFVVFEKWQKLAMERPEEIGKMKLDLKFPKAGADGRESSTTVAVLRAAA